MIWKICWVCHKLPSPRSKQQGERGGGCSSNELQPVCKKIVLENVPEFFYFILILAKNVMIKFKKDH